MNPRNFYFMKGFIPFYKTEYQYYKYVSLYEGYKIVSAKSITAP